jgi:amino-acid N-acetyltransferase
MSAGSLLTASGTPLVREAIPAEYPAIRALLTSCALPTADLVAPPLPRLWVAGDCTDLQGVIGLEIRGHSGLLRSLAVAPAARGSGLAGLLLETAERTARAAGLEDLVLLTETADAFFLRHGYRPLARTDAPRAVQASSEFRSLCPASARCLHKPLR